MLVLSRREDEQLVINDTITITILRIRNGQVKLGVAAPKHIRVHRREVWEAIERRKEPAIPAVSKG